ncbi:MAG TPA: DUF4126 domain-containing protein [Trueperaceae bacterium]
MEPIALILLGIGLAAATGFRVFVPPLMMALGHQLGWIDLPGEAGWLENPTALALLGVATFAELIAFYVPFVDNLLDAVATPAALVAGTLVAGTVFPDVAPWLDWTAAAIVGGGAAGTVQMFTSLTRATSTGTTAGLGNPIVATGEWVSAVLLTVLSFIAPVLAGVAVLALIVFGVRLLSRRRKGRGVGGVQGR